MGQGLWSQDRPRPVVWRAEDGTAPDGAPTPKAAQDALDVLLEAERAKALRRPIQAGKTFGEAGEAFVRHAASVGGKRGEVSPSTLRGYRSIFGVPAPDFPPDTRLVDITSRQLEEYRERLLAEVRPGRQQPLNRGTVRHRMIVLRMILKRAVDLGWLGDSPAQKLEILPQPPADTDFNVLQPSQVEAVARAVASTEDDEVPHYRHADGAEPFVDRGGLER